MAQLIPVCTNCKYLTNGVCRRYPPAIQGTAIKSSVQVSTSNRWPVITNPDTDTCGEFLKK